MTICIYRGHVEGKNEENLILPYLKVLPKSKFGVMYHSFFNRSEEAPILTVIEKIILRKGRVLWKMYITITLKLVKSV
ncbi:hypothetical protein BCD95_005548 [Clostridium beijerinckii]|uniref:Uncharacterized protein n=1 Tax=Clostridium beijerinckii TaxID=1520 RepID=A0AAE5EY47_CLOBE|nr:hypothetical protein [Clostridium beijerinckii]OOM24052.1 putative rRNA methylase [Clostridium beijerinckii]